MLAGSLAAGTGAHAGGILVGNLDQPPVTDPGSLVFVDSTNYIAQQFTTANDPAILTSILVSLGELDPGTGGDSFSVVALLVADSNNSPTGSVLTSFTLNPSTPIPTTGNGYANVEFDPTSNVLLAANTPYWFVLQGQSADGSGKVYWQYTLSTDHYGNGSLPYGAVFYADPPGQDWQVFANTPSLIQVNAVPEPAATTLGAIAAGLLSAASVWMRARRRRS